MTDAPASPAEPPAAERRRPSLLGGLVGFETLLYDAVALLLAAAAVFVLVGTVHELAHAVQTSAGAVDTGVTVLDRILLLLIIAELAYTLRFVLRTHEIALEPFLFIGLIAVVRRILIVTAQLERIPSGGRLLTNFLLELGLLGFLVLALAVALALVRRRQPSASGSNPPSAIVQAASSSRATE
jgi:uncharacterized membrane protein (DUF373 family)